MAEGNESPSARVAANPAISLAVRRPVGLLMITLSVFVFGLISFDRLPMDLMPEISYPSVTIRTRYPGAAPEDVEERVSRRLEQALSVVKNLRRITSSSRAESSEVLLEFTWDNDMKASLQEVREKLDQTFLPEDAETPTILRYDPNLDPVMQIGFVGDIGEKELRRAAEEEVERRLETVQGVAAVRVRGGLEDEIAVAVDEELIRARGVTIDEIARRLAEENLDQAGGLLKEGDVTYVVRTRNPFLSLAEVEEIPIRREGESVLRLGDVARVLAASKERQVITRIDGKPAVKIEVYREAGANIVELAERVRLRMHGSPEEQQAFQEWKESVATEPPAELERKKPHADKESKAAAGGAPDAGAAGDERRGGRRVNHPDYIEANVPEGCKLIVLSDQSTFIEGAIDDLLQTAVLGGVLAVLVLFAFLGRFAYTAIVALSIPFSVVATFAPMHLGSISLNIMSLGGLAFGVGMLVDASIVVLEAIFRRRESGIGIMQAAIEGASEVGGAVLSVILTTVAVFFPIVFVEGIAGQMFRDHALTVVYSQLASLVASLSLIPMLAARAGAQRTGAAQAGVPRDKIFSRWTSLRRFVDGARFARRAFRSPGALWRAPLALFVALPFLVYAILGLLFDVVSWLATVAFAALCVVLAVLGGAGKLVVRASEPVFGSFRGVFAAMERGYVTLIRGALAQRALVLATALLSLAVAAWILPRLGTELVPEVAQGEFGVLLRYSVGTPLAVTERLVSGYERALADLPEVEAVVATIGVDPEDARSTADGEHTARFLVRLRRSNESMQERERRVIAEASALVGGVADHSVEIERKSLFSFRTPIEVEIKGYDLEKLRALSDRCLQLLSSLPELRDVRSSVAPGHPEVHLHPDREKMARYGVTSRRLAELLRDKNMGNVATRYHEKDRRIDMRVRLEEADRDSIEALLGVLAQPAGDHGGWSLRDLIDGWTIREGPAEIRRIDQQRAAVITADTSGLDLGRGAERVEETLRRGLELPPDFSVAVVGQKKEMEESRASMASALLLAIFLVYVVMAAQFESIVQPFIIMFTIPLAVVGVVVTLWVTGTAISVMSFIGMIVLAGIVVDNAIVLLDHVNQLRAAGMEVGMALVEGGRRRLRPIVMTTLTTALGMLPLTGVFAAVPHSPEWNWLFGSGDGAEIRAPLAYTVIGGLLSSTLLTLVVIPVVYALICRGGPRGASQESAPEAGVP